MTAAKLVLASRSPRRLELLRQIGLEPRCVEIDVDETPLDGESPADYVQRLALAKARAGWAAGRGQGLPVLGADTAVVVGQQILGKPRDRDDGLAMLERLAGGWHRVLSGVAVVRADREAVRVQESAVCFRPLLREERERYWDSGEPCDKAGGYAIQGLAAVFVAELRGSHSGVVGLPLFETAELLGEFGIQVG